MFSLSSQIREMDLILEGSSERNIQILANYLKLIHFSQGFLDKLSKISQRMAFQLLPAWWAATKAFTGRVGICGCNIPRGSFQVLNQFSFGKCKSPAWSKPEPASCIRMWMRRQIWPKPKAIILNAKNRDQAFELLGLAWSIQKSQIWRFEWVDFTTIRKKVESLLMLISFEAFGSKSLD